MKKLLLIGLLALCGCTGMAPATKVEMHGELKVETIFIDSEGYTIKRFLDGGHYRYYVVPKGTVLGSKTVQQGKSTIIIPEAIETK